MVTVIRRCEATREARSGTRRMTVPLITVLRSALSQSQKSAENNSDCHSELRSDAGSAEWSAEDDSAPLLFNTRFPSLKKARGIIVTVIRSCETTRRAQSGALRMTVHDCIIMSCLVLDKAMIINLT
jgi:hypothetical protein